MPQPLENQDLTAPELYHFLIHLDPREWELVRETAAQHIGMKPSTMWGPLPGLEKGGELKVPKQHYQKIIQCHHPVVAAKFLEAEHVHGGGFFKSAIHHTLNLAGKVTDAMGLGWLGLYGAGKLSGLNLLKLTGLGSLGTYAALGSMGVWGAKKLFDWWNKPKDEPTPPPPQEVNYPAGTAAPGPEGPPQPQKKPGPSPQTTNQALEAMASV